MSFVYHHPTLKVQGRDQDAQSEKKPRVGIHFTWCRVNPDNLGRETVAWDAGGGRHEKRRLTIEVEEHPF